MPPLVLKHHGSYRLSVLENILPLWWQFKAHPSALCPYLVSKPAVLCVQAASSGLTLSMSLQDLAPQLGTRAILSWDLLNGTRREPLGGDVELLIEKEHAIRLRNISSTDAGLYSCFLAAPLKEKNQESWLRLSVTGESTRRTEGRR